MEPLDYEFSIVKEAESDAADERRRRARERLLRERREQKRRAQEKKRRIIAGGLILLVAALLILLLVLGIRAVVSVVHRKNASGTETQLPVAEPIAPQNPDQADGSAAGRSDSRVAANGTPSADNTLADGSTNTATSIPGSERIGIIDENTPLRSGSWSDESTFLGKNMTDNGEEITIGDELSIFSGYTLTYPDSIPSFWEEGVYSSHGILIDASNGTVVRSSEGSGRIYPASMTKLMTVLVAAEHITEAQLSDPVTITIEETDYAFSNDLSAVNFDLGETVTVRDLFYGTILPSGGDAALALAKYVAGSEENFVLLMNQKVAELGLADTTHFTNCAGMHNEQNYSTCADMALILKAALENDFLYEVLHAHRYTTSSTAEHPDGITISNWFLRRIEDHYTTGEVLCAKTGFVNESRSCAASFAITPTGHLYLCVTSDGGSSWQCIYDHVHAYANYTQ